jgi:predicted transcriptional regulator
MDILDTLFGSGAKVKIMKLFVLNPDKVFESRDISKRSKVSSGTVRSVLSNLKKAGLIKQKTITKGKRKIRGWHLNEAFPYFHQLKSLISTDRPFTRNSLIQRFRPAGRVKLIITSGAFLDISDSRVDLLVVGDSLKPGRIDTIIKKIESEAGKELRYAISNTDDFRYRLQSYDKFIRDILDYPHEVVLDKIGLK